jgi:hypothetical protein
MIASAEPLQIKKQSLVARGSFHHRRCCENDDVRRQSGQRKQASSV